MSREITIEGPSGSAFMAWVGGMPEREYTFSYRDEDCHFYFYADQLWDGNYVYDVNVKAASTQRFTGALPEIRPEHLPRIRENILLFFEQRDFPDSDRPNQTTEKFRNLTFSWRLRGP